MWRPETRGAITALAELGFRWPRHIRIREGWIMPVTRSLYWFNLVTRACDLARVGFHVREFHLRGPMWREGAAWADARWTGQGVIELTTEKPPGWMLVHGGEW